MTDQGGTRVAWLLTVEDVPTWSFGRADWVCLAQSFAVDATTGALLAGLANASSPVG